MFAHKWIYYISILFFISCTTGKKITKNQNIFKGDFKLCNNNDESIKYYLKTDSSKSDLKIFTNLGLKVADLSFTPDSIKLNYAFNDDLEKRIKFYISKFQNDLCSDNLVKDIFNKNLISHPSSCYILEKLDPGTNSMLYNIYSLKQERLFTLEFYEKPVKNLTYRIFSESFCIEIYSK